MPVTTWWKSKERLQPACLETANAGQCSCVSYSCHSRSLSQGAFLRRKPRAAQRSSPGAPCTSFSSFWRNLQVFGSSGDKAILSESSALSLNSVVYRNSRTSCPIHHRWVFWQPGPPLLWCPEQHRSARPLVRWHQGFQDGHHRAWDQHGCREPARDRAEGRMCKETGPWVHLQTTRWTKHISGCPGSLISLHTTQILCLL